MTFYIERNNGELEKERWGFTMFDLNICLDSYYWMTRESTRKRTWKTERGYERLRSRDLTMEESKAVIPKDVETEAIEKTRSLVKVVKWEEYSGR